MNRDQRKTGSRELNQGAEHSGKGDGCAYTVTITMTGGSGNGFSADVLVGAPPSR